MNEKDEEKQQLDEYDLFPGCSSELLETSPSLEQILFDASDKLTGYRFLTPSESRTVRSLKYDLSRERKNDNLFSQVPTETQVYAQSTSRSPDLIIGKKRPPSPGKKGNNQTPRGKKKAKKKYRAPNLFVVRKYGQGYDKTKGIHRDQALSPDTIQPVLDPESQVSSLGSSQTVMGPGAQISPRKNENFEIYMKKDRENFMPIPEFFMYFVFLISVSIVAFGSLSFVMYYYSYVISDIFTKTKFKTSQGLSINFRETRTIQEFWDFMNNTFIDTLFFQYFEDKFTMMTLTLEESKLVVLENIMIGVPRIRQVRVKPDSCKIPVDFTDTFRSCYGYYKASTEDKQPFGQKKRSEWTYADNIASGYSGKISTYGSGGYYLNLTRNYEFSKQLITYLHDSLWIDHGTRAVFIDFTLYSPNINLFCVAKLVAEFPPSGGVIPSSNFYTLKFLRYVSYWDHVIFGFEVVTAVMLFLYTGVTMSKIIKNKWHYLWDLWNILDLGIVILGWNLFAIGFLRYYFILDQLPPLIKTIRKDDHGNFDSLSDIQRQFDTILAFFVTAVWIKLVKYMMLIKVIYHLLKTFSKCAYELLGLTFILIILLTSFAMLGHLLFGSQVEEFGSIGQSIISLTILSVGALDYKKIQEARPLLGPMYFTLFIYFFILIFLCLFVAVVVNGFTMVRFEMKEDRNKMYLKNILLNFLKNFLNIIKLKRLANKLREKMKRDIANENYSVIVDLLRRSGFHGEEMKLFLKKHNVQKGRPISKQTMQQIYDDIDGKGQLYIEAVEHEQILNEVDLLRLRMSHSEKMAEELDSKIQLLLEKVSSK